MINGMKRNVVERKMTFASHLRLLEKEKQIHYFQSIVLRQNGYVKN